MEDNRHLSHFTNTPGNQVMPNQSHAPFSAQDVLYSATHDNNGLFIMMRKKFIRELEKDVLNARNEAIRYHKNVGLADKDNVLPRIVLKLEHHASFYVIISKIKALLGLFELFHKESGPADVVKLTSHEARVKDIIALVQQIISLGEQVKPVPRE